MTLQGTMDCKSILLPSLCQPDTVSYNADPKDTCGPSLASEALRRLHRVAHQHTESSVVQNSRS